MPVGRPVSDRMSLRESREPKLSLRFELWVDEELPDFLINDLTFDEAVNEPVAVKLLVLLVVVFDNLAAVALWVC